MIARRGRRRGARRPWPPAAARSGERPQPPPAASVRFAVKGDWGYGGIGPGGRHAPDVRRGPPRAVRVRPHDRRQLLPPDGVATAENFWRPERCLRAARVRWRAAWGNHDAAGGDTAAVLASPRRYYAFSAGPARVVVLDGNDPADAGADRLPAPRAARRRRAGPHRRLPPADLHGRHPRARRGRPARVGPAAPSRPREPGAAGPQPRRTSGSRPAGSPTSPPAAAGAPLYPCVRPLAELRRCVAAHHFLVVTATARRVSGARRPALGGDPGAGADPGRLKVASARRASGARAPRPATAAAQAVATRTVSWLIAATTSRRCGSSERRRGLLRGRGRSRAPARGCRRG